MYIDIIMFLTTIFSKSSHIYYLEKKRKKIVHYNNVWISHVSKSSLNNHQI